MIFSWAEHINGGMVHVDSVPQGLACDCICPRCRERLLARHGSIRHHGFAHHSETRGANLRICYMVTLYKLAEQIILQKKKIFAPSYYGIFKEKLIELVEVRIDSRYERIDKQPDIVAKTSEGKQLLIEFNFDYKVQRRQPIDYRNLNCLEIDLSGQTLESLEYFLICSKDSRSWLNNQDYFESIEAKYKVNNKFVRITDISVCSRCELNQYDCSVKIGMRSLTISNSGHKYHLCKREFPYKTEESIKSIRIIGNAENQKGSLTGNRVAVHKNEEIDSISRALINTDNLQINKELSSESRTCFLCKYNLDWMCKDKTIAHCGAYAGMGVPRNTPPETARNCKGFKVKVNDQ